jgi:hypothetical protein
MDYTNTLKTLQEASAFDLFRLRAAIDRVLDQPGWMQAVQSRLRTGQSVQYFDPPTNRAYSGQKGLVRLQLAISGHLESVEREHSYIDESHSWGNAFN